MSGRIDPPELDRARVEALTAALSKVLRRHLRPGPPSRVKVYEALNALSWAVSLLIVGAGGDRTQMRQWFHDAVDQNIESVRRYTPSENLGRH